MADVVGISSPSRARQQVRQNIRTEPSEPASSGGSTALMEYLKGRYVYLRTHIQANKPPEQAEEHKQKLLSTINLIRSLFAKLEQLWQSNEIEQFHRDQFIERLCELPLGKIIDNLKKELAAHSQQSHPYYQVFREAAERQRLLRELEMKLESSRTTEKLTEGELTKICNVLSQLRYRTLLVLEGIGQWKKYMRQVTVKSSMSSAEFQQESSLCRPFNVKGRLYIDRLRADTAFLHKSILSKFIYFGDQSDPLFLTPYKTLINSENSFMERHESVVKLFNLNFDIAFRLNQAQKTLVSESVSVMCPPIRRIKNGNVRQMEREVFQGRLDQPKQKEPAQHKKRPKAQDEAQLSAAEKEDPSGNYNGRQDEKQSRRTFNKMELPHAKNIPESPIGKNSSRKFKLLEDRYLDQPMRRKRSQQLNENEDKRESHYLPAREEGVKSNRGIAKYDSHQKVDGMTSPKYQVRARSDYEEQASPVAYARKQSQLENKYSTNQIQPDNSRQPHPYSSRRPSPQPKLNSRITLQPIDSTGKQHTAPNEVSGSTSNYYGNDSQEPTLMYDQHNIRGKSRRNKAIEGYEDAPKYRASQKEAYGYSSEEKESRAVSNRRQKHIQKKASESEQLQGDPRGKGQRQSQKQAQNSSDELDSREKGKRTRERISRQPRQTGKAEEPPLNAEVNQRGVRQKRKGNVRQDQVVEPRRERKEHLPSKERQEQRQLSEDSDRRDSEKNSKQHQRQGYNTKAIGKRDPEERSQQSGDRSQELEDNEGYSRGRSPKENQRKPDIKKPLQKERDPRVEKMDNYSRRKPASNIKDESNSEEDANEDRNNHQDVRADGRQRQKERKDLVSASGQSEASKAEQKQQNRGKHDYRQRKQLRPELAEQSSQMESSRKSQVSNKNPLNRRGKQSKQQQQDVREPNQQQVAREPNRQQDAREPNRKKDAQDTNQSRNRTDPNREQYRGGSTLGQPKPTKKPQSQVLSKKNTEKAAVDESSSHQSENNSETGSKQQNINKQSPQRSVKQDSKANNPKNILSTEDIASPNNLPRQQLSPSPSKSPKKIQIRIRQPKIPKGEFSQYLQQFINQEYVQIACQSRQALDTLTGSHFNLVEVQINQQPTAVAICCKNRRNGNIRIKCFLFREDNYVHDILRVCSNFIFNKDPCDEITLEVYQQKDSQQYTKVIKTLNNVGYYLTNSTLLAKCKRTIQAFSLKRFRPFNSAELLDYYSQGLSCKCSMLTLKSTNQKEFDSDEIEPFTPSIFNSNYFVQSLVKGIPNYAEIAKSWKSSPSSKMAFDNSELFSECPADMQSRTKLQPSFSIKDANDLLEKEKFDTYETSRQISGLTMVRFAVELPFEFPFIIDNNYLLFTLQDQFGRLYKFDESRLLLLQTKIDKCYLALLKNDTKKLQARSLEVVLKDNTKAIVNKQSQPAGQRIGVHFMDKQLYGKVQDMDAQHRIYGNMELSLVYKDYLQGGIARGTNPKDYILYDQLAVVGIVYEHNGKLLPAVQTLVDKADLLFF